MRTMPTHDPRNRRARHPTDRDPGLRPFFCSSSILFSILFPGALWGLLGPIQTVDKGNRVARTKRKNPHFCGLFASFFGGSDRNRTSDTWIFNKISIVVWQSLTTHILLSVLLKPPADAQAIGYSRHIGLYFKWDRGGSFIK